MDWIKNNTPKMRLLHLGGIMDIGFQQLGERASLADNSTLHTDVIEKIAQMFLE